jgi:gliding motility-associated-like protein
LKNTPKHNIALKKNLLFTIGLLFLFNLGIDAANRYWVGGTGAWNDPAHWSATSGGPGGASVPAMNDDVFFDENAVANAALSVTMTGLVQCKDLVFSEDLGTTILLGNSTDHLEIYGSLIFSEYVQNNFRGEIAFKGNGTKNIDFKNAMPLGNVRFSGSNHTAWNLSSNLFLSFYASIIIEGGQLNASTRLLQASGIQWTGTTAKSLNLSNSKMVLAQTLDESGAGNSTVIKYNTNIYPRSSRGSRTIDSIQVVVVRPLCNNTCDGSASVTVFSPTTGPFGYTWTGSSSCPVACFGNPLTGMCNGSYLLTVTDSSDMETYQQFVQIIAPNPFGANFVKRRPKCFGDCNGSMTANITVGSGTPPYTYSWNTTPVAQTTATATGLCAGPYIFTVTDTNNCTQNFNQTLTQPPAILPNAASTNLDCNGTCDGTATAAPTGGNAPFNYTYSWMAGGFTTQSISALCAGTYTVTVRDDSLCLGTATVIITEPPPLVLTPASTNISCFGACDGTAGVDPVSGGNPGYTYFWAGSTGSFSGQGNPGITNVCPGTYTVTVTDQTLCTQTSSFTITEPAPFTVTATGTNVSCFAGTNGSVTATVAGGTGPFTYVWTPGTTTGPTVSITNTMVSQIAGTYTVDVTDANGCTATATVTITEPTVLSANPVQNDVSCFGECDGSITATPTGGTGPLYTYEWTSILIPPDPTGAGTATISDLCPGTYSVTVTDQNGCESTQSAIVTEPPQLTLNISKTDVDCNAACNGTATANVAGGNPGYTYVWSGPPPLTGQGTTTLTGLCPGLYSVIITDTSGCTQNASVTITQPNNLAVTLVSTTLDCFGDCDATATATVTGGTPTYSFSWAPGVPSTTSVATNLCADVYTVTVTDSMGCIATASTAIAEPTPLVLTTNSTNVSCFGTCTGTAQALASGGTPGYSYLWTPGGFTTPSITNLCAGSYTVCVTDLNGCVTCAVIVITQPNQLVGNPTITNNVICFGACNGTITSSATGGITAAGTYTYFWAPGVSAAEGQGTPTIINQCPGTYTLTVTDSNSCTSIQTVVITQPPPFTAVISASTSSCNICNGTATVTASGGTPPYDYLWSNTQTGTTASLLCPNISYTVTVTDSLGCTATATVTISQVVSISMTTSNTVLSCFGACDGVATATPSGGLAPYGYLWSSVDNPGPICGQGSPNACNLCEGTYYVTAVDANGCSGFDSVTFTNPPVLDVTATTTNASCGGVCDGTATANGIGGNGAYSYLWSDGQTTQTAIGLCAGTHTVTITAGTCSDTTVVTITEPSPIIDNPTFTDANCSLADGSISVAPTGGTPPYVTYVWTGPGAITGQGTPTITNLIAGSYNLAITDNAGCVFNFSYLLNNLLGPTLTMTHTNVSCNNACDGTATVTAIGGTPGYTYNWTPVVTVAQGQGNDSLVNLCGTTTYTITVTDALGCIALDTATVINPTLMAPNPTVVNETCAGSCDGGIDLNPDFGGTPPYTYVWSGPGPFTGQGTPVLTNLCPGSYSVTITDNNGCTVTVIRNIISAPAIIITLDSTNVTCNGLCNGTAVANVSGGSGGPYTYLWSHSATPLDSVAALCPGVYTVTVGDGTTCTASASVTITEPPVLTISTTTTPASCFSACDGMATVTPNGGTPPYSYTWSSPPGGTNDTATSLCVGTYNISVTDANGCTVIPTVVTITEPPVIVPNVTFTNPTCNGSCNGTAVANPTGGSGVYTYLWSPGGFVTDSVSGLCAGSYTATISSPAGCSVTQVFVLTNNPVLIANPASTSPSCASSCNGSVTASPIGGTGAGTYSFLWNPGSFSTQTVTNLCADTYTLVVTDANSCTDTQTVVMSNPLPVNIIVGSTAASCGVCDGTITISPTTGVSPYTYVWTPAPTVGQGTPNASSVCAGLYDVLVTDSLGCDSTFTIALNNSGGPTGETVTTTDVICSGDCDGTGIVLPIGGVPPYTYLWTPAGGTNDTAINLCAGGYFVEVTDSNSCIRFSPVTINEPSPLITVATVTSAVCSNVCTGAISLSVSGGIPGAGYTYLWTGPGALTGQGTPNITGLCSGTYTVTITDSNSCVLIDSFVVSQSSPLIGVTTSSGISCSSACTGVGSVNITSGTAPFLFQWNDFSSQTNDTATALCAGTYTVTVTDSLGCVITPTVNIIASPAVTANAIVTDAACGACDGSAIAAPSGGTAPYDYLWSNGDTTISASNLCAGLYTLDITDSAGCTSNFSIPVNNSGGPTSVVITSTNVACNGSSTGAVTAVTPSGGLPPYTYLWIGGGQTTQTLAGLGAGVYYVQVTDSSGCSLLDSVTITEPAPILANQVVVAPACGASDGSITITPSGGTAGYTISPASPMTGLAAGIYSVQITDNAGCVVNVSIPLNSQNPPTMSVSATNVRCNGSCDGTATVIATGTASPYQYDWNDVLLQTTPTATGLCAGSYAVTVEGTDGCIGVSLVNVTEPPALAFSLANSSDPLCNGDVNGNITVIPSGGTLPYTYSWSPGTSTADTLFNVGANSYTVTVTDQNGCVDSQTVVLTEPPAFTIAITSVTNPTCSSVNDGAIDITVAGGTQPYDFTWSGGSSATTEDLTAILSGTYTIVVTDTNSCTVTDSITLTPIVTVNAAAGNDTSFCDLGSITLSAAGSVNAVNYEWFNMAGVSQGTGITVTVNPPTGTTSYYVIVDNGLGCPDNDTITVTSAPLPVANAGNDSLVCQSGVILLDASGSTGGAVGFEWFDMSNISLGTNDSVMVTPPVGITSYYVSVDNGAGCFDNDTITLTLNPLPVASAGNDTTFCDGGASITLDASASANAVSIEWFQISPPLSLGTTAVVTVVPPSGTTSYYVLVDNGSGCTDIDTITVSSNSVPTANAGSDVTIVIGNNTVIGGSPTGPSGSTFLWSPIPGLDNATSANPLATPATTTTYTVTVTSAQGCTATDAVTITVLPTIFIPDGISPNADGDNDEWMLDGIELFPNCVVEVYNRWGELLFQSVGYKERWKGTYNGKELPVGTYYYVIDLKDPLFPDAYTGPITILR